MLSGAPVIRFEKRNHSTHPNTALRETSHNFSGNDSSDRYSCIAHARHADAHKLGDRYGYESRAAAYTIPPELSGAFAPISEGRIQFSELANGESTRLTTRTVFTETFRAVSENRIVCVSDRLSDPTRLFCNRWIAADGNTGSSRSGESKFRRIADLYRSYEHRTVYPEDRDGFCDKSKFRKG